MTKAQTLTEFHLDMLKNVVKGDDFSFKGQSFICRTVDVYDGDSIRVKFYFSDCIVQHQARLFGIDTPEMKPPLALNNRKLHKQAATISRDFLISCIMQDSQLINIHCEDFDKYGRMLVTIIADSVNINDLMIDNGYALEYDGGTKVEWTDELINLILSKNETSVIRKLINVQRRA